MLRALSVAWALVAALAVGFVPPAGPQAQVGDVATIGVVGVSGGAPTLSARRARAKLTHLDGQGDGSHPVAWPHALWLATTTDSFVAHLPTGAIALATPPAAPPSTSGTARTSRGPPALAIL